MKEAETKPVEAIYQQKINDLEELKKVFCRRHLQGNCVVASL